MKKRIKKTVRNFIKKVLPQSFLDKRVKQSYLGKVSIDSYIPQNSFSIVSAVYNVEEYLDDFFDCIVKQSIKKNSLQLIVVDDGSTDCSAEIIKKWQQQYQELIVYVRKENGGQGSARNLGLNYVSNDWVTFIDPDDFVAFDYFEQLDLHLVLNPSIKMISSRYIYYYESENLFTDNHPLSYRFKQGTKLFDVKNENHPIQLSMNSVLFKVLELRRQKLFVHEDIYPCSEDGHFVNRYMLNLEEGLICFSSTAKYFYRKRKDESSTLDVSWEKPERLSVVPEKALLDLLEYTYKKENKIPNFIQEMILYELSWYYKHFVGKKKNCNKVSVSNQVKFEEVLKEISVFLDSSSIQNINENWFCFEWKQALLESFEKETLDYHVAYLVRYEPRKNRFLIRTSNPDLTLYYGEKKQDFLEEKKYSVPFLNGEFLSYWMRWYECPVDSSLEISFSTSGKTETYLSITTKRFKTSVVAKKLFDEYSVKWGQYSQTNDCWLIMDRDTQADDNAEHFYRWLKGNIPEQEAMFALRKNSNDWKRLELEGFKLLDFGSREFETYLKKCSKIISSHADNYITSYYGDDYFGSKDFVFLQHGVTKDDQSDWFNQKKHLSLLVTASKNEYRSISEKDSPYRLTPSQVVLTGFPRHDCLLKKKKEAKSDSFRIAIMPTWRDSLVGKVSGKGNNRAVNPDFGSSEFCKKWQELLCDEELKKIADEHKCKITFFPHANIWPYVENGFFNIPSYVELAYADGVHSMQDYFIETKILITDYSSVAFEVGYLEKPVIYYQFDKNDIESGATLWNPGYFNYETDGFGPVVELKDDIIDSLRLFAKYNFELFGKYRENASTTFAYRDGNCCERVYNAITKQ